ncbi:retrovirus polyprotein [Apiospora saccharicola]
MAAKPSPKHMKRSDTQSPLPAIQKRIRELEDSKSEDEDSHSEDEDSAVEDEDGSRLPYRRSPIEAVPTQKGGLSPDSDLRKMDRSLLDNRDADIDEPVLEEPDYRYHNLDVYPERDEQGSYRLVRDGLGWHKERPLRLATLCARAFAYSTRNDKAHIITLAKIDKALDEKNQVELSALEEEAELKAKVEEKLSGCYKDFHNVFSKKDSDVLAPYRPGVDHHIELNEGSKPEDLGYSPLYKII